MRSIAFLLLGLLLGGLVVRHVDRALLSELYVQLSEADSRLVEARSEIAHNKSIVQFCDDVVGALNPPGTLSSLHYQTDVSATTLAK